MSDEKISEIIKIFKRKYPEPKTQLKYSTPFQLLIATILSAQTTDKQVNLVTSKLFKEYNTPEDFAQLKREELEAKIKSIGLYRNKSKYIIRTSRLLINEYEGKVPSTRDKLMKLPGVGRKTANVILTCAFKQNTFPVDTHVFRVSNKIGLASSDRVSDVETQLMQFIPEPQWHNMHHWLIFHGREICKARNPLCDKCELRKLCNYYQKKE